MLRGLIYVRGKVDSDSIGLKPPKEDIINYLSYMNYKGIIDDQLFEKINFQFFIEKIKILYFAFPVR